MDIETELNEKILVLQRALPQLKVVEIEMGKIESNLNEATEKMKEVGDCLPFVKESLARLEMLARKCCLKRLMVNSANTKIEDVLSLVNEPDKLLELVMEKVVQLSLPMENLPKTLVTQILEWPSKKMENVRIKLFLIDLLKLDEINLSSG